MPPFDEFFQAFISNMLEYIDNISFSRKSPTFQFPGGVFATVEERENPIPLLLPCNVMVFPREEMLASYVHFFVERKRDLNGKKADSLHLTPLSIVERLLMDYEYIDGECLFIIILSGKPLPPISQEAAASLFILPRAATLGASYRAAGTFTALSPGDLSFKYGEALTDLFLQGGSSGRRGAETEHSLFGKLSLSHIERESPPHLSW